MKTPLSQLLKLKGSRVHSVSPSMTVAQAVEVMNAHRVGCVLVMQGASLTGVFTERDVLFRVVAQRRDPDLALVSEVMSANPVTITSDATVEDAMRVVTDRRCRHLPVVDGLGQLQGLISAGDLTRWLAHASRHEAEHLKAYLTAEYPG